MIHVSIAGRMLIDSCLCTYKLGPFWEVHWQGPLRFPHLHVSDRCGLIFHHTLVFDARQQSLVGGPWLPASWSWIVVWLSPSNDCWRCLRQEVAWKQLAWADHQGPVLYLQKWAPFTQWISLSNMIILFFVIIPQISLGFLMLLLN